MDTHMDTQKVLRGSMSLTDATIRGAAPDEKPYKLTDGQGMYLLVCKSGSKYFRLDYRLRGHRKTLALGVYPRTTLKQARNKLTVAKQLIAGGIDPVQHKNHITPRGSVVCEVCSRDLTTATATTTPTFEAVAREWVSRQQDVWSDPHSQTITRRLEADIFPHLGTSPVSDISSRDLLTTLRRVDDRGAPDLARRLLRNCSQILRYAVSTGLIERDPAAGLQRALTPTRSRHMSTLTDPRDIGRLLHDIDVYPGQTITRCALQLAPLVFVRPGELRRAEWSEIDFDEAMWRIPARKMKSGVDHIVPLSRQALDILRELQGLTGTGRYVFPAMRKPAASSHMGATTIILALRRMGWSGQMTGHGFRGMASTLLHEQGWESDVIERQLAHTERNSTKSAYNHAQYMPERRKMMQAWADYLDKLRVDQGGEG